jgi:hypothetical protein
MPQTVCWSLDAQEHAAVAGGGSMMAELYDPEYIEQAVHHRHRTDNPFSEENLKLDRLVEAIERGGDTMLIENKSGRAVASWHIPGEPKRATRREN